jgi:hypothetical protein
MSYPELRYHRQETAKVYSTIYTLEPTDEIIVKQQEDGMLGYASVGQFATTGSNELIGTQIISGSLEISGSAKVNGNNVITEIKNTFNPQFTDSSGSFAGGVQTGHYTLMNDLCFFRVNVDFGTTTNFGIGQYQITLPFPTIFTTTIRNGTLHQTSGSSGGTLYNITGVTTGSSAILPLFYTGTTSYLNWKFNTPVSASTTSSHFDINGVYEIA